MFCMPDHKPYSLGSDSLHLWISGAILNRNISRTEFIYLHDNYGKAT